MPFFTVFLIYMFIFPLYAFFNNFFLFVLYVFYFGIFCLINFDLNLSFDYIIIII